MDVQKVKKAIVEEFKKEGLEITEDAALRLAKVSFRVAPVIIQETDTKLDDVLLLPVLGLVSEQVFKLIDKIDGHVG